MTSPLVADRPSLGDARPWSFPVVERHDAGDLTVWTSHLPGQQVITVKVWIDAPVTAEPAAMAGIGMITSWALDEGAAGRDANDLAAYKDRLGAGLGTGVSSRGTALGVDAPAAGIADACGLLRDVLAEPWFPADEVVRLVRQRGDSLAQEQARIPGRAALELKAQLFADGDRMQLPGGGTHETLQSIDREAVVAHHATALLGQVVHVVIAGDLSLLDIDPVALVAERLDGLGGGVMVDREPSVFAGQRRLVVVDRPGAVQTGIEITRPGDDRRAPDWAAQRVASHVLGGTLTSRLDAVLREEKGFTYGSRSALTSMRRGGWQRLVAGSFETPTTPEALADIVRLVNELRTDGAREDETTESVRYLAGVQPLRYQTAGGVADEILRNLADGFDPTYTDTEHEALTKVTTDEVSAAAAQHLRFDDAVTVLVGDAASFRDAAAEVFDMDVTEVPG